MFANGNSFNGGSSHSWKPPQPVKPGLETGLFKYISPVPGPQ